MLLATLRDASKKQAEERALDVEEAARKGSSVENGLDVEEAAKKGSSVENGPSAVANFR